MPEPQPLVVLEGANIQLGDTKADGLHLNEMTCAVENAPLFGTLVLIAGLAKQAAAFDRCAPKGDAAIVSWAFVGGRARDVKVKGASSPKIATCIAGVLKKAENPFDTRCAAVILIGDDAGAAAAHTKLRTATP